MLPLPLLQPHEQHSIFLRPTYRPRSVSPPPTTTTTANGANAQLTHRERQKRDEERKQHHARSPLALLSADEAAIEARKAAVRNFGAHWIRPLGISKTLQTMNEEELERQEQAELERQERGLLDMQAQQQLAEAQQQAADTAVADGAGEGEGERDLDDDIPEAEASAADVTFNEDSMVEGSQIEQDPEPDPDQDQDEQYAEMEEAELTGAARDEEDLGIDMERDLDDSVPEAGSYQHTDTEIEDSDSESELPNSFMGRSAPPASTRTPHDTSPMQPPQVTGLQARMRAQVAAVDTLLRSPGSLNLSSSVLDNSMAAASSSPVMQRSNAGNRPRGRRGRNS